MIVLFMQKEVSPIRSLLFKNKISREAGGKTSSCNANYVIPQLIHDDESTVQPLINGHPRGK